MFLIRLVDQKHNRSSQYYGTSQPTIITVESPYKKSLKSKEIILFKDIRKIKVCNIEASIC